MEWLKAIFFSERKSTLTDIYFWTVCLFFVLVQDLNLVVFAGISMLWLLGRVLAAKQKANFLFALGLLGLGVLIYLAVFLYHTSKLGSLISISTLLVLILLAAITGLFRKTSI